ALAGLLAAAAAEATPQFARRYAVGCGQCHVLPPKLNAFGEQFLASGYEAPLEPVATHPLAVWVSGRGESRPTTQGRDEVGPFFNRVELISGGKLGASWLSYFVEWRVVSQETRGDGTLRDRAGRFEDLFVSAALGEEWELKVGQFRPLAQIDVSRRLWLSEPLVPSSGLAGVGDGTARERSLRGFSAAGRSPGLLLGWNRSLAGDWRWTTAATLAVPGEISIPLTSEAKLEASHEIELEAKGIFVESFLRHGLTSVGAHVFYDDADRYLGHAIGTLARGPLHGAIMAGVAAQRGTTRGRWSVEGEYLPGGRWGLGLRLEDQAADGAEPALLPYFVWHWARKYQRLTATVEQRVQEGRNATLIEVGLLF
ncbi:MAG TPA: hypothetical protein VMT16_03840, partial [Thermoanaerobaculia bacterium]|nr:hypothetical protein [Thermoanaerobaculia bacterium]